MKLSPITEKFILHWGEMGAKWGVNRTEAQIQALLFLSETPMNAEEIAQTLGVARSNVSNSLRSLQSWRLVQTVQQMGDRRDYFHASKDVWELVRTIFRERKEREFDPTVAFLESCLEDAGFSSESEQMQTRIRETLDLMRVVSDWGDQMLKLSPGTLLKVLKLGARIQKLIGADKKKNKKEDG